MSIKCAQTQWQAVVAHFNPSPQKTEAGRSEFHDNQQPGLQEETLGVGGGDTTKRKRKKEKKIAEKNVLNRSEIYRTEGRLVNKLK